MNCSRKKDSWWHFTSGSVNHGGMNFGCFMPPRKPTLTARWSWHYHWLQSLFVHCRQSWLPPLWCPLAPYTASVPAWPSGLEMSLILSLECLKDRHHPGHLSVCSAQPRTGIDTHLIMMEGGSMFPGPHWHSVSGQSPAFMTSSIIIVKCRASGPPPPPLLPPHMAELGVNESNT